jgi:hypothetical protein
MSAMTLADQLAVLPALTNSIGEGAIPNEITITLYAVVSDVDGHVHGPFTSYDNAAAFAEAADGSVLECTTRLMNVREV